MPLLNGILNMIKFYYVEVKDCGHHYTINNILPNTVEFGTDVNKENFLPLSSIAYKIIEDSLSNDYGVKIKKPLFANEVLPVDLIINKEKNDIDFIREANLISVKSKITPEMTKESGYTMYEFMKKHTEMMDAGYFITDKNREMKYMEIIETDDDELIELLESYLETRDKIERGFFIKQRFDILVKEVRKCNDEDEIRKLCDDMVSKTFNFS